MKIERSRSSAINQELYQLGIDNEPLEIQKQMIEHVFLKDMKKNYACPKNSIQENIEFLKYHLDQNYQARVFYYYMMCLTDAIESLQNEPIQLLEDTMTYVEHQQGKILACHFLKGDFMQAFLLLYQTFQTQYTYEYDMSVPLHLYL